METSATPRRIQRRRTRGWKMPEGAVYVGRPSKWGNPFIVGDRDFYGEVSSPELAVRHYRSWMTTPGIWSLPSPPDITALRGKDLVCWCSLLNPCHGDVLLELASGGDD